MGRYRGLVSRIGASPSHTSMTHTLLAFRGEIFRKRREFPQKSEKHHAVALGPMKTRNRSLRKTWHHTSIGGVWVEPEGVPKTEE